MGETVGIESVVHTLQEHPFLQGLDPKHIRSLACCVHDRTFRTGEYLWRQGQHADWLFLVRTGEIALEISIPNQGPLPVETIVAGEVLGWSWLVPPYRWHFDARALTAVHALALEGSSVRELCEQDEGLGYQLLKRFAPVIAHRLEMSHLRWLQFHHAEAGRGRPVEAPVVARRH